MTSKNTLIIGTRGSALALAQADMVCAALSLRYPELDVRREIIHTIGDRRTDVPLADVARVSGMVDKGIFIKELETALRDGRIDVAVHSLKDVPSELAFRLHTGPLSCPVLPWRMCLSRRTGLERFRNAGYRKRAPTPDGAHILGLRPEI